jgi:ABC-type amino acid transport substrate-binding protein
MKRRVTELLYYWAVFLLSWVVVVEVVAASEPRITPGLFSPERLEIFAYEYPPLVSIDIPGGGLYPELVNAAFAKVGVDVAITIMPVKSLVRYSLLQDNALGVIGSGWGFSDEERYQLIVVPFYVLEGGYVYYKPAQKKKPSLAGGLGDLKGHTYGAQKGEDVSLYEKAGISIRYGKILALFNQLKSGEVDFISMPDISRDWIVSNRYPSEQDNYLSIVGSSWEESLPVLFNRKNDDGEEIAGKFRVGLKKIIQDGSYFEILRKYHGKNSMPKDFYSRLERYQGDAASSNTRSE